MYQLIKKDFKLIINIKKQVAVGLCFILIFLLFSTIFKGFMKEQRLIDQVHIGIVDQEDSRLSKMLVGHFKNNEEFMSLFEVTVSDQATIDHMYQEDVLSAIVYIPEDFTNSLLRFRNTPINITLNPNYPLQNTLLENIMASYSTFIKAVDVGIYSLHQVLDQEGLREEEVEAINEAFSVNMVLTALNRNAIFEHQVEETFPSATSNAYFTYAIILLMIIFVATSGASLITDELKSNCLQRFKTSSQSFAKFVFSKSLVMYINLVILVLPLTLAVQYYNQTLGLLETSRMFLFLSLVAWFFINLSMTLGLLFPKKEISLLISTLTTLVLGILGGHFIPIQVMPKFIQDISSLTPNYWMLRACLYLNGQNLPREFYITCSWIFIGIVGLIGLQVFMYKKEGLWEK